MHVHPLTQLLNGLRHTLRPDAQETDGELLARFVASRDEKAFEMLVLRHGGMVLGVCRRVLGHDQDSEDAFQATFLVLARNARAVRPPAAVGRWLYGVAYHTALKARAAGARRRLRESQARAVTTGPLTTDWPEVRAILDEELSRLPNDYREVVVRCDLEGLTRRQAALQLAWPEGTVAGRLARARELLAARLTRRGVTLSVAGLGWFLNHELASACPSASLISAAVQSSLSSGVSAAVVALADGAVRTALVARLQYAALLLLAGTLTGFGWSAYTATADGDQQDSKAPGLQVNLLAPEKSGPNESPNKVLLADEGVPEWVRLFNGKDLAGWVVEGDNPGAWRVEHGELLVDSHFLPATGHGQGIHAPVNPRGYHWLLTEKTYSDFRLRFEYQLSEKAASGLALWATRYEKVHPEGPNHLQVKLLDDPHYPNIGWPTGTLFWNTDGSSHLRPDRNARLEPVGSWNRMEIEARAQLLRVSVNGAEVLRARPDALAGDAGAYAGLTRHSGQLGFGKGVGVARFRKIEIKELGPTAVPDEKAHPLSSKASGATANKKVKPANLAGWVSLFNGKDLAGWKTHPAAPGDWRVEDGILIGRGPKVSHLYTERSDYEDVHFRVEAKINAGGNSGQSFRKQFSAKIGGDGYEAQIDSSSHKAKTGSLYIHVGPAVAIEQLLVPVDTWFTQEVIVRGNHIVILVNGRKTVDFIDRNNNYVRGHLALQVYDPATVVQFRRIEVKELPPPAEATKTGMDQKTRTTTMRVIVLINDKTEGLSKGAKIAQIDPPNKGAKRGLSNLKQNRLNGLYEVKTCTLILADGKTLVKSEVLFGIEPAGQAVKNLTYHETVQGQSDLGPGAWHVYTGQFQMPVPDDWDAGTAEGRPVEPIMKADAEVKAGKDKVALALTKLGASIVRCGPDGRDDQPDPLAVTKPRAVIPGDQAAWRVVEVNFNNAKVRANGWKDVTDAGLRHLKDLKSLRSLDLSQTQITDAGLKELKELKSLRYLWLDRTRVTDAGLKELKELKDLQNLRLNSTRVTGSALTELKDLTRLETLALGHSAATDVGLKDLKELKSLRSLELSETQITDAALKDLKELKSLAWLDLGRTRVTDAGLKELAGLNSLQGLLLGETEVTLAGLKKLRGFDSLHTLSLARTKVADAALKELGNLNSLRTLDLSGTAVMDAGLKHLASLNSLYDLDLRNTKVTDRGIKELQAAVGNAGIKEVQVARSLRIIR